MRGHSRTHSLQECPSYERQASRCLLYSTVHLHPQRDGPHARSFRRKEALRRRQESLSKGEKARSANDCVSINQAVVTVLLRALQDDKFAVIVAPYEADAQVILLEAELDATCVYANDADLLVMGVKNMVSEIQFRRGPGYLTGKLFSLDDIIVRPRKDAFRASPLLRHIHGRDAEGVAVPTRKPGAILQNETAAERLEMVAALSGCDWCKLPTIGSTTAINEFRWMGQTWTNRRPLLAYFRHQQFRLLARSNQSKPP